MSFSNKTIVKINCDGDLATGFLYQRADSEYIYIITCRHAVIPQGSDTLDKQKIEIQFFDDNKSVYRLGDTGEVIHGENDQTEDYAVIILNKSSIPNADISEWLSLAALTVNERECIISGIPKVVNNEAVRTLYDVTLLSDRDFDQQIQLEVADPVSDHYHADALVEGYSGSPIMIKSGEQFYVIGIFQEYEPLTRRVKGLQFYPLNEQLKERNFPLLEFSPVETRASFLADINSININTKRVLKRIKNMIGDVNLKREKVEVKLMGAFRLNQLILISGDAGIGKSSLTKQVISALEKEYEIIALQGEQLDKLGISDIFRQSSFNLVNEFEIVLDSPGLKKEKILLIDSIEKVLETTNAETINDFFDLVKQRTDLKIVVTCRSYAVQQLKIRFLKQFPSFAPFEVPLLSDEELLAVGERYPTLKALIEKPSLKPILRIPFNLDKATYIGEEILSTGVNSEREFKQVAWEYIIQSREKESDVAIRKARTDVFEKIAIERAKQMVSYVHIGDTSTVSILEKLVNDNIIEENPLLAGSYASTHDIYEDWALTRFIEHRYQLAVSEIDPVKSFISALDFAPSIRRAFRIWVSEKIQDVDQATEEFLSGLVKSAAIDRFWKDEVLIAIMQSAYSSKFLENQKMLLSENDYALFKRCTLLLTVACQGPDLSLLEIFKEEEKVRIYKSGFLKPFGVGWHSIIEFTYRNISEFESAFPTIMSLLIEWAKGIENISELPGEARSAGFILLKYLDYYQKHRKEDDYRYLDQTSVAIDILLKLVPIIKEEVKALLSDALAAAEKTPRHKVSDLHGKIFEKALAWPDSHMLCKHLPELVIGIAEQEWLYFPPTSEEVAKAREGSIFKSLPREQDQNEKFGIVSEYKRDYFPASAFQTPVGFLLKYAPAKALQFIVSLFNHSVNAFLRSDFLLEDGYMIKADQRKEITYELADGNTVTQQGSLALWVMYRGHIYVAMPHLLESVLMALEAWLLALAEAAANDKKQENAYLKIQLDHAVDYLLQHSKTVSTTAVIVSVALAYPQVMDEKILPLLKIKEFYKWDLYRKAYERKALSPSGGYGKQYGQLYQKERHKSNHLKHRQEQLETLFLKLSFGRHCEALMQILDDFHEEVSMEQEWKIALNRMDRRKLEVIGEVENGVAFQTKIDEDLKPMVEEAQAIIEEMSQLSSASNWSFPKLKGKDVANNSYEQWKIYHAIVRDEQSQHARNRVFNNQAALAAVGVKHYYHTLSKDELDWSISRIFQITEHQLQHHNPYDIDMEPLFGAFEPDSAIISLVEIINQDKTGDYSEKTKELLFLYLLLVYDKTEKEDLIEKIKAGLWNGAPSFAYSCVSGLIAYSRIADTRWRIDRMQQVIASSPPFDNASPQKVSLSGRLINYVMKLFGKGQPDQPPLKERELELQELINSYNNGVGNILTGVLDNSIQLETQALPNTDAAPYYVLLSVLITPVSITDKRIIELYKTVLNYVLENQEEENRFGQDRITYENTHRFLDQLVAFLMIQPEDVCLDTFNVLTDWIFTDNVAYNRKKVELVQNVLEKIITYSLTNPSKNKNFWVLWNHVSEKMLASGEGYFADIILLDYQYWEYKDHHWDVLTGKRDFFKQVIGKFGSVKSVARLLSGVGSLELMPEGLLWLQKLAKGKPTKGKEEKFYIEKLALNIFYDRKLRQRVRNNHSLKEAFIILLDDLIDNNVPSAFLIREDFISLKN